MATAHKRTLFHQLVGLNKQDDTFHSMMESCASFETLGVPSVENNNERGARRTISSRVTQLKKKLAAKKRDTDSPHEFLDGEMTSSSARPKHSSARSGSKSPAPRRGTGDTESQSELGSVGGERKDVDDMANETGSALHGDVDDSTKRKRRTFFGAFLLPGHNSNKTLDPQNSTKTLENDPAPKQHPLNESISSKQETHPLNQSLSSKHQNECHSLNHHALSAKHHESSKKVRSKRPESEPSPSGEKRRSRKSTEKKKMESDSEQSHGNLRMSHGKSLNQSKEDESDLPSPLQESQRSRLEASHTSLKNADSAVTETSTSPRRSPRSRKQIETEDDVEKRKTRRSLSPRRRLKQPTSEEEGDNPKEAGLSPSKSPKKRGSSPRRRKLSHELSFSKEKTDIELSLKTSVMDELDIGNANAMNVESQVLVARAAIEGNSSEQDEIATPDRKVDVKAVNETLKWKGSNDNGVNEPSHKGDVAARERKSRQDNEKSRTRRSRSVTAIIRTRHVSKSRDLSLSPDKQRHKSTRESRGDERRSQVSNRVKDLCLKLEKSSEKRPRGSSASLSPRKESSLKNMLEAATPLGDRKCLTVVSPQDYEKKKKVTNGDDAIADQSLMYVTDTTKRILKRVSPKKSPDILATSPRISTPPQKMARPLESSKSTRKSSSSSRMHAPEAEENHRLKEAERGSEDDARGRARHRVEQLRKDNNEAQQRRPRSSSRQKKERGAEASLEQRTDMRTHPKSLSKSSDDALRQSQSKSPRTILKKITRLSSPIKGNKASPVALNDSQRDSNPRKSPIQRTKDIQSSQIKMSTHSMPEKSDVQRIRRPVSKSPARHTAEIQGQRQSVQKGFGDIEKNSKRNEQLIRRVMSARNIDGHQSHHFEVEELTKSGSVVKRKLKVVPASDVETLGSMLLQKDTGRGTPKLKKGHASPVAAQLHIPDLDESQKSNLKVKYTEYNEISMLDNYVDDVEESDSVQ
ncbi:hypothetical protein FisN_7Lu315 [Fistulifera solaris]|uniref:Uncharacterized protein n=1 Tax=Fistulifera solaris TaxID=1519565 RepID=A0A1Z5JRB2_FISSO|nr:hypothetical protein FisN_7Lu315 [Fistulifera solaris]|eukprot:GAX16555.1 hypothetical protein FisN_7Lu315 [Fistulifera solaris]